MYPVSLDPPDCIYRNLEYPIHTAGINFQGPKENPAVAGSITEEDLYSSVFECCHRTQPQDNALGISRNRFSKCTIVV